MSSDRKGGASQEWERVAQNPDNVIVSDSIRSAVMQLLEPNEPPPEPSPPAVILQHSNGSVSLDLFKFESTGRGWLVSGTSSIEGGEQIISMDRAAWEAVRVTRAGGETLWQREVSRDEVSVEVQFTPAVGTCVVTLSSARNPEQSRVL